MKKPKQKKIDSIDFFKNFLKTKSKGKNMEKPKRHYLKHWSPNYKKIPKYSSSIQKHSPVDGFAHHGKL